MKTEKKKHNTTTTCALCVYIYIVSEDQEKGAPKQCVILNIIINVLVNMTPSATTLWLHIIR